MKILSLSCATVSTGTLERKFVEIPFPTWYDTLGFDNLVIQLSSQVCRIHFPFVHLFKPTSKWALQPRDAFFDRIWTVSLA
ncbi:unnamed protein product [Periconia digitata]|uniref:Uncharacterized protein n=1 Tax=Periconia digitata TaxID=1303443 RepID=A0A9W4U885_9PLEO|nr:unnamed protein product [Periconia digitata]